MVFYILLFIYFAGAEIATIESNQCFVIKVPGKETYDEIFSVYYSTNFKSCDTDSYYHKTNTTYNKKMLDVGYSTNVKIFNYNANPIVINYSIKVYDLTLTRSLVISLLMTLMCILWCVFTYPSRRTQEASWRIRIYPEIAV